MQRAGQDIFGKLMAAACCAAVLFTAAYADADGPGMEGLAKQLVRSGEKHLARGEHTKAVADFEEALRREPDLAAARTGLKRAREEQARHAASPKPAVDQQSAPLALVTAKARSAAGQEALIRRDFAAAERHYESVLAALPDIAAHRDVTGLRKEARNGLRRAREGLRSAVIEPATTAAREAAQPAEPARPTPAGGAAPVAAIPAAHRGPPATAAAGSPSHRATDRIPAHSDRGRARRGGMNGPDSEYSQMVDESLRDVGLMMRPTTRILSRSGPGSTVDETTSRAHRDDTTQVISQASFGHSDDAEDTKLIQARLLQRVSVSFKKEPFTDAIDQLRALADINILVDPAVGPTLEPVTISTHNMELRSVLYWMLRFQGLDYRIRRGVIFISNEARLAEKPITVVHDIADLLRPIRDRHPDSRVGTTGPTHGQLSKQHHVLKKLGLPDDRDGGKEEAELQGEEWVQFIKRTIKPGTWAAEGDAAVGRVAANTINFRNGKLVVNHTREVQDQIRDLLASFRKAQTIQVAILSRFIEVTEDFFQDIGIQWGSGLDADGNVIMDGLQEAAPDDVRIRAGNVNLGEVGTATALGSFSGEGGLALSASFLKAWQLRAIITAVRKEKRGTVLTAPRVTTFNNQQAYINSTSFRHYVRSYDADGNPEIGQAGDQIELVVTPVVSADRRYITLDLQPRVTTNTELQEFQVGIIGTDRGSDGIDNDGDGEIDEDDERDANEPRQIQLPSQLTRILGTRVSVPDGGTLLIGGLARAKEADGHATVPVLGDLPLLKYLFRSRRRYDARRNLIVLVTAHIIQLDQE
jgi:Flp pilus assembly secretin CpaC